jgi:hypothetical protein
MPHKYKFLKSIIIAFSIVLSFNSYSQDLNQISGNGFNIIVGPGAINIPEAGVHTIGIQSELDLNYRWQMVNSHGTDNFYLRRHVFGWSSWNKIWHSGNLNKTDVDFLAKNVNVTEKVRSVFVDLANGENDAGRIEGFVSPEQNNLLGMNFMTAVGFSQTGTTYQLAMSLRRFWNGSSYSSRLSVHGEIIAKEIKVQVSTPADYVFENDYTLMPLNQLETYIKENKHLPNIPSASKIIENGWEVGEMNNLMLEKIEELTLYVIDLKKEIEVLKANQNK